MPKSKLTTKLLESPQLSLIVGAVLVVIIVTCFIVSVSLLTGFAVVFITGYAFKFVTRQILAIKSFAVEFVNRLTDRIIKIIKDKN